MTASLGVDVVDSAFAFQPSGKSVCFILMACALSTSLCTGVSCGGQVYGMVDVVDCKTRPTVVDVNPLPPLGTNAHPVNTKAGNNAATAKLLIEKRLTYSEYLGRL